MLHPRASISSPLYTCHVPQMPQRQPQILPVLTHSLTHSLTSHSHPISLALSNPSYLRCICFLSVHWVLPFPNRHSDYSCSRCPQRNHASFLTCICKPPTYLSSPLCPIVRTQVATTYRIRNKRRVATTPHVVVGTVRPQILHLPI